MSVGVPTRLRKRLDPSSRYGLRVTLFAVAFVLVAVPFFALVFEVTAGGPLVDFDSAVADTLNSLVYRHPVVVTGLNGVSWIGLPPFLALCTIAGAGFWLRHGRRRLAVFLVVTAALGSLIDTAVKLLVNRPRPVVDHPVDTAFGKSFPSGHAMASTVVFGALLLAFLPVLAPRLRKFAIAGVALLVLAIGCSRLLLGVHFVSDVVGGYVLGLAWLAASSAAFEHWRTDRGRRRTQPLQEGVEPEAVVDLRDGPHATSARFQRQP